MKRGLGLVFFHVNQLESSLFLSWTYRLENQCAITCQSQMFSFFVDKVSCFFLTANCVLSKWGHPEAKNIYQRPFWIFCSVSDASGLPQSSRFKDFSVIEKFNADIDFRCKKESSLFFLAVFMIYFPLLKTFEKERNFGIQNCQNTLVRDLIIFAMIHSLIILLSETCTILSPVQRIAGHPSVKTTFFFCFSFRIRSYHKL